MSFVFKWFRIITYGVRKKRLVSNSQQLCTIVGKIIQNISFAKCRQSCLCYMFNVRERNIYYNTSIVTSGVNGNRGVHICSFGFRLTVMLFDGIHFIRVFDGTRMSFFILFFKECNITLTMHFLCVFLSLSLITLSLSLSLPLSPITRNPSSLPSFPPFLPLLFPFLASTSRILHHR